MSGFVRWYPQGGAQGNLLPTHPWDRIALGGQVIPCHHARITSGGLALLVDKKKTLGGNGGHPTYHGIDPHSIDVDVFFSTVEQAREFAFVIAASFGPSIKGDAPVIPIEAQQLQHLGCLTTVKIRAIEAMTESGIYKVVKMKLDHWLNPPAVKGKSVSSSHKKPINNAVTEAAALKANPKPAAVAGFCGAPGGSTQPGA